MKSYIKYISHKKNFIGEIIISMIMVIILLTATYYNYRLYQNNLDQNLKKARDKIENRISDIVYFTKSVFISFGEQIASLPENDYEKISRILIGSAYNSSPLKIWIGASWVDKNNYIIVNSIVGSAPINKPYPLKSGFEEIKKNPWNLSYSNPIIGPESGRLVVPVAMGVINNKNKYIGYVLGGLSIIELYESIESLSENISVAVFNSDNKNIFKSSDIKDNLNTIYFKNIMKNNNRENFVLEHKNFIFKESIIFPEGNISILLGYNKTSIHKKFFLDLLPKISEILAIWVFFICVLFFYRRRVYTLNIKDVLEHNNIMNEIINKVRIPLISIHKKCTDISSKIEATNTSVEATKKELHIIAERIKHIIVPVLGESSYEKKEVGQIIKECIYPFKISAKQKKISFTSKVNFKRLEMDIDEIIFRKIIIGLLTLIFEEISNKGEVSIKIEEIDVNNNHYLEIRIGNKNNFELDDPQISQILERVGAKEVKNHGQSIDFNYLKVLIEKHGGTISNKKLRSKEKVLTVCFPICSIENNLSKVRKFVRE